MKKERVENITPAVHLEFVQNQAGLPENQGAEEIEQYHRALFLHHHAHEIERYQQQGRVHEDRLTHLETRLKDTHAKLAGLEKLVPVNHNGEPDLKPTSPWNGWDRTMFIGSLVALVALLIFGILNISFNLLESGLITFVESPIRAYFWAALLPVGALAVKIGWDFLEDARKRNLYLWSCLSVGIAGVLVWVAAYAAIYPTLSKTTSEHIDSLTVFDQPGTAGGAPSLVSTGAKRIDAITVAAQAVAEIFLSAVLGMYMTALYTRHRPVRLAQNPAFTQLDEERRLLEESVERERTALAEARGNENRLQHQLTALVSYAKSMFQKESALRKDESQQKRILLDQLSEQIRAQLESVENGSKSQTDRTRPPLVLSGQNGR